MSEAEFMQHYEALADPIFRHCYFRVYDRERAKELTQETFTRMWKYTQGGGEVRSAKAFLYRTATNLVIDEARRRKRFSPISLDALYEEYEFEPGEDPTVRTQNAAEGKMLLEQLEHVDAHYREVMKMRFIEDMEPKEIAEILGTNRNMVSIRLNRGMHQLKKYIETHEHKQ